MLFDKLIEYSNEIFESSIKKEASEIKPSYSDFPAADYVYEEVIKMGGIHAFSKSLRIFGFTSDKHAKNIIWWNKDSTWKYEYKKFFRNAWAFAEDIFGNQFLFDQSGVAWLNSESGETQHLCKTFSEWIEMLFANINFYTGMSIKQDWEKANPDQELTGQYLLCPTIPFILGGEYKIDNLFRIEGQKCMLLKAKIAQQIRNLPDGTKITINFQ
jgi:hypothetical protein